MKTKLTGPASTVESLMNSLNQGDVESAVDLYDSDAVFFPEPGRQVNGRQAIRHALSELVALKPSLSSSVHCVVETDTTALYCSHWTMTGTAPDGTPITLTGRSSDVLRLLSNGSWLIAIDNPFGPEILGHITS